MIDDVSNALRLILDDKAIESACKELFDATVRFDRPTEQFKPDGSTVDLFLYDLRENTEMRSNEPLIERRNGKAFIQRPPLRVACSYLVTAWPQSEKENSLFEEQRMLSQAIQVFSYYPTIPAKFFPKDSPLRTQQPPLPMMITQMEGVKDPADFWSAIGGKLRPSFVVTVTISLPIFDPNEPEGEPLVGSRKIDTGERTSSSGRGISAKTSNSTEVPALMFSLSGTVTDAEGVAVKGAKEIVVTISELGMNATADVNGRYDLGQVPKGRYNLRVEVELSGSKLKTKSVPIDVSANNEINLPLDLFKISGKVTDTDGTPVRDAAVTISKLDLKTSTDTTGQYNLRMVPIGRHTLHVEPKDGTESKLKPADVPLVVSASAGINVKLEKK
jgi:Pvc16 N-terminal domain/Carboxypeptidase regulatory-like domain